MLDLSRQLGCGPGKLPSHGGGDVDHLESSALKADFLQQLARVFDSPSGVQITFQVMTIALQSTGHHYAVSAALKGIQHVEYV